MIFYQLMHVHMISSTIVQMTLGHNYSYYAKLRRFYSTNAVPFLNCDRHAISHTESRSMVYSYVKL